jgi:hypothetical protein
MPHSDLRQAARAIAMSRASGEHPAPDMLVCYHAETLADDDKERVKRHLTSCRDCASAVLDMASFPKVGAPDAVPIASGDVARNWQRFEERLQGKPQEDRLPWWMLFTSLRFAQAMAVLFLVTSVSLTGVLVRQGSDDVRANVQVAELTSVSELVERSSGATIRVADSSDGLLLILPLADPDTTYQLEIIAEATSRRLTRKTITRTPDGRLTVELTRQRLQPGRYRAEIRPAAGGEVLAIYAFVLKTDN